MDKLADDLITAVADREQYAAEAQTLAVWLENRELGILEFIEANPMQGMKLPKAQYERIAPPTPAAAAVILAVAKGHVYRAVMLRIFLGVRIGPTALFRLKWQDLDFERRTIREWSAVKNKNMPFRDVPIRENLLEEMKVWVRSDVETGHEFIVHFKGKPIASIKSAWRDTKLAAAITMRMRPYDLCHAFHLRLANPFLTLCPHVPKPCAQKIKGLSC